jgi:hypothetical protein
LRCRARAGKPDRKRNFLFRTARSLGNSGDRPQATAKGLKARGNRGAIFAPGVAPISPSRHENCESRLPPKRFLGGHCPATPFRLRDSFAPHGRAAWGLSHLPLIFDAADTCGLVRGSPGAGRHSGAFREGTKSEKCGVVCLFDALVIFQRLRGRGNRLMFSPPPETPHPFLLKRSGKENQKRQLKEKVLCTLDGSGNARLTPISRNRKIHSLLLFSRLFR